jgi:glycosyltransferase involved in cell wall biosynthesis
VATISVFVPVHEQYGSTHAIDANFFGYVQALTLLGHSILLNTVHPTTTAILALGEGETFRAAEFAREHAKRLITLTLDMPPWKFGPEVWTPKNEVEKRWLPPNTGLSQKAKDILNFESDTLLALSNNTASEMARFGVLRDIETTYISVPSFFHITAGREKKHQCMSIGKIQKSKHYDVVVKAIAAMEDPPEWLILGNPQGAEEDLTSALEENPIPHRHLLPYISDAQKMRFLSQSQFLVTATTFEGFGLPPGEALCAGIPAVCADIPVIREVYGDFPIYFKPLDASACTAAMEEAMAQKRAPRGAANYIRDTYSVEALAVRLRNIV